MNAFLESSEDAKRLSKLFSINVFIVHKIDNYKPFVKLKGKYYRLKEEVSWKKQIEGKEKNLFDLQKN